MEKQSLMDHLLQLESPFSWDIPSISDVPLDIYIDNQTEKFRNVEEENDFKWTKFILSLLLGYELCDKKKNHMLALGHIKWCKDHLLYLKKIKCQEPLFSTLYPTLFYVTCITEAIILLRNGEVEKAHKALDGYHFTLIARPTKPSPGLLGTKAALYLQYGTEGHRLAYKVAKEAMELDPDQGEWWFLIGNALGRIRRTENGQITDEEIKAIEKAFVLERNASYIVHLAQLYSEYSAFWFYSQNEERSKKYAKAAVTRYREAIDLRPQCMLLKARVAHGMLRLRDRDARDIPFAKDLLDQVVEATPSNSMVFHDLGYYYEKFERDTTEALDYLTKANNLGNIKALIYMMTLKWKHGKENDMIKDLTEGLTKYKSRESQAQLSGYLGACYAIINSDWNSAVECFQDSLSADPSAKYLEKFYGFDDRKINLLELVTNHLHMKLQKTPQECPENFRSFVNHVTSIRPDIIHPSGIRKYIFWEWRKDLLKVNKKNQNQTTGLAWFRHKLSDLKI